MKQQQQNRQRKHTERVVESLVRQISWDDGVVEPSKDRVESHGEWEATCKAAWPDASGHEKLSSGFPCKLDLRQAVAINHAQGSTNEPRQLRLPKKVEDPGVIDARLCGSKVGQKDTRITCGTCARAVVSTSKMLLVIWLVGLHLCAGCMQLMQYLCRPKHIAVVMILQSQLHKVSGRKASSDLTIRSLSSTLEDLGMKNGPARS